MTEPSIELLKVVCNPSPAIPIPHRLAILSAPAAQLDRVATSAADQTIHNAIIGRIAEASDRALIAVPDVARACCARISMAGGEVIEVETRPVQDFQILLMPTSHLCFGYNASLPEHIEAGRVVSGAAEALARHPDYRWNIEFVRGAQKLFRKYPELREAARRDYARGRLGIGATWTSSTYEHFDAEAEVRQIAEAQWWLRENLGTISNIIMGCDSSGYDPQQPQLLRQAGIAFYWRCRYTLNDRDFGSPLLEHLGIDGTRIPCYTSRTPIGSGYIWSPIPELKWGGPAVDPSDGPRFAVLAAALDRHIRDCREILGAGLAANFSGNDQSLVDTGEPERIAVWNRVFRTPSVTFATIREAADRLQQVSDAKRDVQEPEQPHWAPITIAGYCLTLPFQETSYALCTAEKAAAIDAFANGTPYPADELHAAWMNILDEQHHEQLGYGAYDQVEHARQRIGRSLATARSIVRSAALRTAGKIAFSRPEQALTVFNFLNWRRRDVVEVGGLGSNVSVCDAAGNPVPSEITESGLLRFIAEVDGMGYATYYAQESSTNPAADLRAGEGFIENAFYRLDVDPDTGCVRTLTDKELGMVVANHTGDRAPFELVVNEDNGAGFCGFWPTGTCWRAVDYGGARTESVATGLAARCVVERPLLAPEGEACVGRTVRITYELPADTKRLDVTISVDWDSPPKRELRLFMPLAMNSPIISYDTLFATSDYDPLLPERQHLRVPKFQGDEIVDYAPYDFRNVARFVSAYDAEADVSTTMSAPHGLLRVEHGGVSFALIEDRTDFYWNGMLVSMKGRRVFHTSLTSHRGNWMQNRDWQFGWEHRSRFNDMLVVVPERLYPVLPEKARLVAVDGDNLVLTALKQSRGGEELIARVYDAGGDGDHFGFRLITPYAGMVPSQLGYARAAGKPERTYRELESLRMLRAAEANLLEDPLNALDLQQVAAGAVPIRPHGIYTARFGFEVLAHDYWTAFGIRKP